MGFKRSSSPREVGRGTPQLRDSLGFRMKRQMVDKNTLTAYEQLGGQASNDQTNTLTKNKTIFDEEAEGAGYIIDGRLRRVKPYFFTYLTYCKMRWRDRKLLDVFVSEFRDRDADYYKNTIAAGQVTLNRKPASLDSVVRNGDLISHRCHRHEPAVTSREIKFVFENEDLLVIDKPSGIPVHPAGRYRYNSVTRILQHEYGKTVHPCNRLDRLTSGLMFLGKNSKGTDKFVQQIKDKSVKKEYIARVVGKFPTYEVAVDRPLSTVSPKHGLNRVDYTNGKEAKTIFQRLFYDSETNTTIVKCEPLSGRTHQIRVHLQYMGHPIANDPIYANKYVWGDLLGKEGDGDTDTIISRLDRIGKDVATSTWMYPEQQGEVLAGASCDVCGAELYTDPGINDLDLWLHAYKYEAANKSWSYSTRYPTWVIEPCQPFMDLAVQTALKCGETQTQFNVGAVLVQDGQILATGHSRELPGNTHAEQCALEKYFEQSGGLTVPEGTEIFTSMEPCSFRLSGQLPCVNRILDANNIKSCFVGVLEPDTFVKDNSSLKILSEANISYIYIPGFEERALEIATKGHKKK